MLAGSLDPGQAVAPSLSPSTHSCSPRTPAGSLLWARPMVALRQELVSHIHQSWGGHPAPFIPRDSLRSRGMSGSLCCARSPPVLLPSFQTSPRPGVGSPQPALPPHWRPQPSPLPPRPLHPPGTTC